jgi:hypothetical protein
MSRRLCPITGNSEVIVVNRRGVLKNSLFVPNSQNWGDRKCLGELQAFALTETWWCQSGLGDREGQRWAVAAAVATEVSGEVGRSVDENLSGTGR